MHSSQWAQDLRFHFKKNGKQNKSCGGTEGNKNCTKARAVTRQIRYSPAALIELWFIVPGIFPSPLITRAETYSNFYKLRKSVCVCFFGGRGAQNKVKRSTRKPHRHSKKQEHRFVENKFTVDLSPLY